MCTQPNVGSRLFLPLELTAHIKYKLFHILPDFNPAVVHVSLLDLEGHGEDGGLGLRVVLLVHHQVVHQRHASSVHNLVVVDEEVERGRGLGLERGAVQGEFLVESDLAPVALDVRAAAGQGCK